MNGLARVFRGSMAAKVGRAAFVVWLASLAVAQGQKAALDTTATSSVSGQFQVSHLGTPIPSNPALRNNTNLLHLEPAFLAVAAERFKIDLWRELGLKPDSPWSGKIFLTVHPARTASETVAIVSTPFLNRWNYRVDFPELLGKVRYARAMSAVLLLEIANRHAANRSAEVPSWLVDGLAQQMLAAQAGKLTLSAPSRDFDDDLAITRLAEMQPVVDPLAPARTILQNNLALTFDQLNWPTDAQMDGADGGIYLASAQAFVFELLQLKNGPGKLRAMLQELPAHLNWQIAFFHAFSDDFKHPIEVEKWWALRVVHFVAHASGPRWATEDSRFRFEQILKVPVAYRADSNSFPSHAEISLQAALKTLTPDQWETVARTKVRDLAMVELRLAPPFSSLADAYRMALADFLGEPKRRERVLMNRHGVAADPKATRAETLRRLDALDLNRRQAETHAVIPLPGTVR